jgi:hypothetical protein
VGRPRRSLDDFIQKATALHKGYFLYDQVVYAGAKQPVVILCPKHGSFTQTPVIHLRGGGCRSCNKDAQRISFASFVDQAQKVHSDRYVYPEDSWMGACDVEIQCSIHGLFIQDFYIHLQGSGCPRCSRVTCTEDFILEAQRIHGDAYDYSLTIYVGNKNKVNLCCPRHGTFSQRPNDHLAGNGCPSCKVSKGERQIQNYLFKLGLNFQRQATFPSLVSPKTNHKLKFDFFLPDSNTLIEFDGEQHFKPVNWFNQLTQEEAEDAFLSQQERDQLKTQFAIDNQLNLFRISYLENVEQKLNSILERN